MKLFIHDLEEKEYEKIRGSIGDDVKVISDDGTIRSCIGCFGCWIKTPGQCVTRTVLYISTTEWLSYGDLGWFNGYEQ